MAVERGANETTSLVPFLKGLLIPEGQEIGDVALVALIRGIMDKLPKAAASLLEGVNDRRSALSSLLEGVKFAGDWKAGDWRTGIHKLQGLIDTAAHEGRMVELLEAMKTLCPKDKKDKLECNHNELMELGRMDASRLELLTQATEARPDLAKVLLRASGAIIRPPREENPRMNDVLASYFRHGLIQAAAQFGNTPGVHALLKVIERTDHILAEMFCSGTLMPVFYHCVRNGDLISIQKIVSLLQGLSGNQRLPSSEMTDRYQPGGIDGKYFKDKLELPNETDPTAVLLLDGIEKKDEIDGQGEFALQRGLESENEAVRHYMVEILFQDPVLRTVVGQRIYPVIEQKRKDAEVKRGLLAKMTLGQSLERDQLSYDEEMLLFRDKTLKTLFRGYEVTQEMIDELTKIDLSIYPASEDVFLEGIESAAHDLSSLENYFAKLFPDRRGTPKRPAGETLGEPQQQIIPPLPPEYDQSCYMRLIELMSLADEMGNARGNGVEWGRKLTLIFNDVEQAMAYTQAAAQWALAQTENGSVWRHRTRHSVNWPHTLKRFHPTETPQVEAIRVAMDFNLPSVTFNPKPWRAMMIRHPEVAQYIELAPEIEEYLSRHEEGFPKSIETLRQIVLEIDLQRYRFSEELSNQLRSRLKNKAHKTELSPLSSLPSATITSSVIPPGSEGFFRRLQAMGILENTSPHASWERLFDANEGVHVVPEDKVFRLAGYNHFSETHEPGAIKWPLQVFQVSTTASPDEFDIMTKLLDGMRGVPYIMGHEIVFDLFDIPKPRKTELVKQLCVGLIYEWPLNALDNIISPTSNLSLNDRSETLRGAALRSAMVSRILRARTPMEIFETYWSNNAPMEFLLSEHEANLEFKLNPPKKFTDTTQERVYIELFVTKCLQLLDENGGRAQDLRKGAKLPSSTLMKALQTKK